MTGEFGKRLKDKMRVIRVCSTAGSAQRKADEEAHPLLPTAIFSTLFPEVIKWYSEPLKMLSILIENERDCLSLQPRTEAIIMAGWPDREPGRQRWISKINK